MDTTSLETILKENPEILLLDDGMRLRANPAWVVPNETKLSYTTIIRLIECCREYHWKKDIEPQIIDIQLDSTCRFVKCDFFHPINVNEAVDIIYYVNEIRTRSYLLHFLVEDSNRTVTFAEIELILVFWDLQKNEPVIIPENLATVLKSLLRNKLS